MRNCDVNRYANMVLLLVTCNYKALRHCYLSYNIQSILQNSPAFRVYFKTVQHSEYISKQSRIRSIFQNTAAFIVYFKTVQHSKYISKQSSTRSIFQNSPTLLYNYRNGLLVVSLSVSSLCVSFLYDNETALTI